jgi:hypothetical protein
MHEGLLVTTAAQVDPALGQYWSTGSEGWPPLLGHGNHEGNIRDLLFALDMPGEVQDLAASRASGQVRKFHLQPSGDTEECPGQSTHIAWRETFLSTGCFQISS